MKMGIYVLNPQILIDNYAKNCIHWIILFIDASKRCIWTQANSHRWEANIDYESA
jgi:hypothetical protein